MSKEKFSSFIDSGPVMHLVKFRRKRKKEIRVGFWKESSKLKNERS